MSSTPVSFSNAKHSFQSEVMILSFSSMRCTQDMVTSDMKVEPMRFLSLRFCSHRLKSEGFSMVVMVCHKLYLYTLNMGPMA